MQHIIAIALLCVSAWRYATKTLRDTSLAISIGVLFLFLHLGFSFVFFLVSTHLTVVPCCRCVFLWGNVLLMS